MDQKFELFLIVVQGQGGQIVSMVNKSVWRAAREDYQAMALEARSQPEENLTVTLWGAPWNDDCPSECLASVSLQPDGSWLEVYPVVTA